MVLAVSMVLASSAECVQVPLFALALGLVRGAFTGGSLLGFWAYVTYWGGVSYVGFGPEGLYVRIGLGSSVLGSVTGLCFRLQCPLSRFPLSGWVCSVVLADGICTFSLSCSGEASSTGGGLGWLCSCPCSVPCLGAGVVG